MAIVDLRPQALARTDEELLEHLQSFSLELRFTAGIWYFSPFASRFHAKYSSDVPLVQRLDTAAGLKDYGLVGLEAHYPNEVSEENLHVWQQFERNTGIKLVTVIPLLFYDEKFEFGSLSNPDPGIRQEAIDLTVRALELNRELDTEFAIIWAGIDGFENPFGVNFAEARRRFTEGLAEAMDAVPGIRTAFEPKPYEPRGRMLYSTTPEGVLMGREVERLLASDENRLLLSEGHALCCMNPEVGHVLMGFEDLASAFAWPLSEGRLAHSHWNSQPLGNYDQDLNVGVVSPEQTEALLYTLKMHGYAGYFGIDINPERMPVETALRISMDALRAANDRIDALDHESILFSQRYPERTRGWIEAHLVRARAPQASRLPELPGARNYAAQQEEE